MSYWNEILAYSILLEGGLCSKEELISYVDSVIAAEKEAPGELVEISLAGSRSPKELAALVADISRDAEIEHAKVNATVFQKLYARYRVNRLSLQHLADELYHLGAKLMDLTEQEKIFLFSFDDFVNFDPDKAKVARMLDDFMVTYLEK